ncbi:MAG: transposase [Geobacter sp.]|nr:MAG: transposase [Geobacter sp.]
MGIRTLKSGEELILEGTRYKILNPPDLMNLSLRNVTTGEVRIISISDLPILMKDEGRPSLPPANDLPPEQMAVAKKRLDIIAPLLVPGRTKREVTERAKTFGFDGVTLYRWIRKFERTRQLSSLAPAFETRGGPGKSRIDSHVEAILQKVIEEEFLTRQKKKVSKVCSEVEMRCFRAGVPAPHPSTVRRRIEALPRNDVVKRREGSKKSSRLFQSVEGSFPEGKHPLDAIQIDHTILDVILVDEIYRKPIGRPHITVGIDICTRMVYGFCLSLDKPGFFAVGQSLYMGMIPKDAFLRKMGINSPWEIFGLPKIIFADNAGEFRCDDMKAFCEEYGIEISWRPVARPQFGGHIERLIGNLNSAIHTLPGTTFSNIAVKGDYKSDAEAVFTISELEEWFTRYFVEIYHNKVHSTLGMTPRQKYELEILGSETMPGMGLPSMVEDEERLRVSLLPSVQRTVQPHGVVIDEVFYFHDVLRKYIKLRERGSKKGKLFTFRQDPRDISKIYFYDEALRQYFTIPYRNIGLPPISVWELRKVKRWLTDQGIAKPNEHQIFQACERLRQIEKESAEKTKLARRSIEARKRRESTHKESQKANKTQPMVGTLPGKTGVSAILDSQLDDIFRDVKPFEGIEVVQPKKEDK